MTDIFDQKILCGDCDHAMKKSVISKEGFPLRVMICEDCNKRIVHPLDEKEYHKFKDLKNKEFRVKMRLVGNSYAVSIPKEIVSFMEEQENDLSDMVKLCFEEMGRVSLDFGDAWRKNE